MAIAIKRAAGGATTTRAREDEDLEPIARKQLDELRERWLDLSARVARGRNLWRERKLAWEEPDWEAEPETWPPVAKVLWLYVRQRLTEERLQYTAHFPDTPAWCQQCRPEDAKLPDGWHVSTCPDHANTVGMTQIFAAQLGLREGAR